MSPSTCTSTMPSCPQYGINPTDGLLARVESARAALILLHRNQRRLFTRPTSQRQRTPRGRRSHRADHHGSPHGIVSLARRTKRPRSRALRVTEWIVPSSSIGASSHSPAALQPEAEAAYVAWIRRFIVFHRKRHPRELGEPEVTSFVSSLAARGVSASTESGAQCHPVSAPRSPPTVGEDERDRPRAASARLPVVLSAMKCQRSCRAERAGVADGVAHGWSRTATARVCRASSQRSQLRSQRVDDSRREGRQRSGDGDTGQPESASAASQPRVAQHDADLALVEAAWLPGSCG
jgi:hypothetical protein